MVGVDIESANSVAYGDGEKFYGGIENCTGQCTADLSKPRLSVALSLEERYLLLTDRGGKRGRDCGSVPVRVELGTAMCDTWRQCCQATNFAAVIW